MPKRGHTTELTDYRPVALTSQVTKILEWLILQLLTQEVQHTQDHLQFAYRKKVGVKDAVLFLLHRVISFHDRGSGKQQVKVLDLSCAFKRIMASLPYQKLTNMHTACLDRGSGKVRVMFFDFSGAFNRIMPSLPHQKLSNMDVQPHLVSWITDHLTGRRQFARLGGASSDLVVRSTGTPQGTVLAPLFFKLCTFDFHYNSELVHMQKFSEDTAVVGCIRGGDDKEYRRAIENFVI